MNQSINTLKTIIPFKSILTLMLGLVIAFGTASAQGQKAKKDDKMKKDKIEELRKKFYNEKLALTETEQKAFWPLYDEYKKKEKALRDSFRAKYKPNDVIFMDDKQAEEFLNATIKLREDQNNLYKEYVEKFKKVISVKKVAMLPLVERVFKKEVMQIVREHHKKGPPPPPGDVAPEDE